MELNAFIRKVDFRIDDTGFLTCDLHLEGSGWSCAFGGCALKANSDLFSEDRTGFFIRKVLDVFKTASLSDVVGKPCRVRIENNVAYAVGNFLTDDWIDPVKDFAPLIPQSSDQPESSSDSVEESN